MGMSNLWTLGPSGGLLAADLTHTRVLLAQSFQKWTPSTEMHTFVDASPYVGKLLKSTSLPTWAPVDAEYQASHAANALLSLASACVSDGRSMTGMGDR